MRDIKIEMCPSYSTDLAVARQGVLMDELEQKALAAGIITTDELRRWHKSQEQAAAEGVSFASL